MEATAYIEELPRFTTKNPPEHTRELLRRLGSPEEGRKILHVAGTNGKGSVCAYLDAMLRRGGHTTGLFTSPHLVRINERFRIQGGIVDDGRFTEAFRRVKAVTDAFVAEGREHPSYFELLFLMGMVLFREADVEYVILETGLGGRLDATNVIGRPLACVITSISRDHTEYLGETIREIAGEKAGIIKPGVPVIYDARNAEAAEVIAERASALGSPAFPMREDRYALTERTGEGIRFSFRAEEGVSLPVFVPSIADYQMMNASLALGAMWELKDVHGIPRELLAKGIAGTRWPCRMEQVLPDVIIDGAHNEDGIAEFVRTAARCARTREVTILFSAVADKRYHEMIREVAERIRPAHVVTAKVPGSRAVAAETLAEDFRRAGCADACAVSEIGEAFETAYRKKGEGMLFCVGSLYLAGELMRHISGRDRQEEQYAEL